MEPALRFHLLYRMIDRTISEQHENAIMPTITANDLKTKGVAAIEAALSEQPDALVSVRGKDRFVVMELSHYHHLRECELEAALAETRADLAAGRYVVETADAHAKRLDAELDPAHAQGD
jgi:PHD/YefM family antitoxin component YafN of YafNO toxin-antitoxin module